ncbi:hypothetical protein LCGC14_1439890 [marine sediment metagenome]|uniref:Cytochrome oxidase subunit I profile domain-containing protein n=1 Tax=marine sediment metagenome TaxID=412755 RepID=A0A0F9MMY7_9ZZZZ|nr:hypothetical protein [archaeon]
MRKKALIIFIIIVGVFSLFIALNVTGSPGFGSAHDNCHTIPGGYTISADINATNSVTPSETITIEITATGSNLFVLAPSATQNNVDLQITPTTERILDGSAEDEDTNTDAMVVTFNITVPEDEGFYYFFVLVGDNMESQPDFAYIEIGFSVGGVSAPTPDPWWVNVYNHLGLYLGLPALLLLSLGTILVLLNENKFVKVHGILAGASWILTVVNISAAFIKIEPQAWFGGFELIYQIPHIILGALGLVTGFFSMLFGIAAERKPARMTGYLTLIFWWGAFLTGYLLNSNLLLL